MQPGVSYCAIIVQIHLAATVSELALYLAYTKAHGLATSKQSCKALQFRAPGIVLALGVLLYLVNEQFGTTSCSLLLLPYHSMPEHSAPMLDVHNPVQQ